MKIKIFALLFISVLFSSCGGGGGGDESSQADAESSTKSSIKVSASGVDEESKFYFFKGQSDEIYLSTNSTNTITYKIIGAPSGVELEGNTVKISDFTADNISINIQASNDNEHGETTITLKGLNPIILIDETTTGGADFFADKYNLVKIDIPEVNNIPVGTKVKLIGSPKDDSLWKFKIDSDASIDAGSINVLLASSKELNAFYNQPQQKYSNRSSITVESKNGITDPNKCSDAAQHEWQPFYGTLVIDRVSFASDSSLADEWFKTKYRIQDPAQYREEFGRLDVLLDWFNLGSFNEFESAVVSILCGKTPKAGAINSNIPILFIHGYQAGEHLGGGKETWGEFLSEADSWNIHGKNTEIFEFRWRTNAKFQDVANDLRQAIRLIANKTGERVHIIAHSFGGVLARTYLQDLANTTINYEIPVASITTIGTPHSGLNSKFGGGYDSSPIGMFSRLCGQISCLQMGDDQIGNVVNKTSVLNEITSSLDKNNFKLIEGTGEKLPIQVLIGISSQGVGDGLISVEGQRFKPEYTFKYGDRSANGIVNNAYVFESLLNEDEFGVYMFFIHSGSKGFLLNAAFLDFGRPEVKIKYKESQHPSVVKSKKWIEQHHSTPLSIKEITYEIAMIDNSGNPVNDIETVSGEGDHKIVNGKVRLTYSYTPGRKISFKLIPKKGSGLLPPADYTVIEIPKNHNSEIITLNTVRFRKYIEQQANELIIKDIELSSTGNQSDIDILGENLDGNVKVTAYKKTSKAGGVIFHQDVNGTVIKVSFEDPFGIKRICVEKLYADNTSGDACHEFIIEKEQDGSVLISALTPDSINASNYAQKITINGSGFTRDSTVYAQSYNTSFRLNSSRFIDENTMSFLLRTTIDTSSLWFIWVETPSNKSHKYPLIVKADVNNSCTANEVETQGCSISHGSGSKYRACAADGNSWGDFSACTVSRCDNGYHVSGNSCEEDVVIPIPDRPSNLTPGSDSGNPEELNTTSITLSWSATSKASKYKLNVFDLNTQQYLLKDEYVTRTSYGASSLLAYGHRYFWSVHACNDNNECSSRTRVYFNIPGQIITPDTPTGLTPGSSSSNNPTEVSGSSQVLRWNAANNASWYNVHVTEGILNSSGRIIVRGERVNANRYTVGDLEAGEKYQWYVEACNDDACSESVHKGFVIEEVAIPVPSNLLVSVNGATASVAWASIANVDEYKLSLKNVTDRHDDKTVDTANSYFSLTNLTPGHNYKFKVRAKVNGEYGNYSDYEFFQIAASIPCALRYFTNNEITEYLQKGYADTNKGGTKTQVAQLQRFLDAIGFDPNGIDGIFGSGTENAVKDYQRSKSLYADGKVGANTRNSINNTCN